MDEEVFQGQEIQAYEKSVIGSRKEPNSCGIILNHGRNEIMEIEKNKLKSVLAKKFDEIAARILKDDTILQQGLDLDDAGAETAGRLRVPFRAWLERAGISRRDDRDWIDGYAPVPGHVTVEDFTMLHKFAVLDVPTELAERALALGGFPDFKIDPKDRKRPEGPIVRGHRNTTRYELLATILPSENGKRIVFGFQNGASFSWNIVDKKFYHSDTGLEFAHSHFGNINWGEAKPGRPSFFETLYKTAGEGWVKNLFAILSNWVKYRVERDRRNGAYKLQEKRLNRLDTMCDPEVIGPIESLAKNNFVDRMNLDRVCRTVFVGDKIQGFSDLKDRFSLDAWFLKHSGERVHPQYCRDDRYAGEGHDLYADDNREWVLGNYMSQYMFWNKNGLGDLFRHVWERYKFVFPHEGYQFTRLHEVLNQLKGWGYDQKRVMDYLFHDLPTQGLVQKMANYDVPHELVLLRDYAKMMVEMDRRYERYPKSLKMCHDIAAKNYTVQQSQILAKKYEQVREGLKKYEWEGDDYVVIVPPTMQSVVQEGASLNHCVASYVDGMVNGEYAILFLRLKEAPEKSLVTLQMHGDRVTQARGQSNRATSDEEKEAIEKFVASLEKQKELELVEAA